MSEEKAKTVEGIIASLRRQADQLPEEYHGCTWIEDRTVADEQENLRNLANQLEEAINNDRRSMEQTICKLNAAVQELAAEKAISEKRSGYLSDFLSLVRAHYERDEEWFRSECVKVAAHLDNDGISGHGSLANFIRAQYGATPAWVPMDGGKGGAQ